MGWGRMLLLGNWGQQLDIQELDDALRQQRDALRQLAQQAHDGNRFDHDVERSLNELISENAELKLYLAAVTRLLVSKGVVTQSELTIIVDAIDRSDGRADGKLSTKLPPAG